MGANTLWPADAADIEVAAASTPTCSSAGEPEDKGPVGDGGVVGFGPAGDCSRHGAADAHIVAIHKHIAAARQAQNLTHGGIIFDGDALTNRRAVVAVAGAVIVVIIELVVRQQTRSIRLFRVDGVITHEVITYQNTQVFTVDGAVLVQVGYPAQRGNASARI